jgi:hypothetical protein
METTPGSKILSDKDFRFLADLGLLWVCDQQSRFSRISREFLSDEKLSLEGFFSPETLALVRVAEVFQIENPPYLSDWRSRGLPDLVDFRQMAGIAFVDTIFTARRFYSNRTSWISLVFHELVHVVQYQLLTTEEMVRQYLRGWADNDFDYHKIPIEVQAYNLQREFDRKATVFSVEDRIRQAINVQSDRK